MRVFSFSKYSRCKLINFSASISASGVGRDGGRNITSSQTPITLISYTSAKKLSLASQQLGLERDENNRVQEHVTRTPN